MGGGESYDVDRREVHAASCSVTVLSGEPPDERGLLQLHTENAGPGALPFPARVLRCLILLLVSILRRLPARVAVRLVSPAGHLLPPSRRGGGVRCHGGGVRCHGGSCW